ncbi:MAG: thiamine-binding protein [Tissierellia bacterium]|nr:thiamine-binding protein [Tissierellia bacterium]
MQAAVALQVLPSVADKKEVVRVVDEVIAYIDSTGVNYEVAPFETTMEGDLDKLLDIVKEAQKIVIREGAPSVMSYVKINYGENILSTEEKIGKYRK